MIKSQNGYPATVGFSSAAWYLRAWDRWITWSPQQRGQQLYRVVHRSRFLIRPGVPCRNLARYVLGRVRRRWRRDFQVRYPYSPYMVETLVGPDQEGPGFKAANFRYLGHSKGRGRPTPTPADTRSKKKVSFQKEKQVHTAPPGKTGLIFRSCGVLILTVFRCGIRLAMDERFRLDPHTSAEGPDPDQGDLLGPTRLGDSQESGSTVPGGRKAGRLTLMRASGTSSSIAFRADPGGPDPPAGAAGTLRRRGFLWGGGLVVKPFGVAGYLFLPAGPAYRPNLARRVEPDPRGVARSEARGLVRRTGRRAARKARSLAAWSSRWPAQSHRW